MYILANIWTTLKSHFKELSEDDSMQVINKKSQILVEKLLEIIDSYDYIGELSTFMNLMKEQHKKKSNKYWISFSRSFNKSRCVLLFCGFDLDALPLELRSFWKRKNINGKSILRPVLKRIDDRVQTTSWRVQKEFNSYCIEEIIKLMNFCKKAVKKLDLEEDEIDYIKQYVHIFKPLCEKIVNSIDELKSDTSLIYVMSGYTHFLKVGEPKNNLKKFLLTLEPKACPSDFIDISNSISHQSLQEMMGLKIEDWKDFLDL